MNAIKDINGYHAHLCSFDNSSIEKIYDGYTVSPVIVAGVLRARLAKKRSLDYLT
jgi:hypothetical protein